MIAAIDELHWSADALDCVEQLAGAREYLGYLIEQAVRECGTNAIEHTLDVVEADIRTAQIGRTSRARIAQALETRARARGSATAACSTDFRDYSIRSSCQNVGSSSSTLASWPAVWSASISACA